MSYLDESPRQKKIISRLQAKDQNLSIAMEIGRCHHSMARGVYELLAQSIEEAEHTLGIELDPVECSSLLEVVSSPEIRQAKQENCLLIDIDTLRVMALALSIYSKRAPDFSYNVL